MGLSDGLKGGMKGRGGLAPGLAPAKHKTLINHTHDSRTIINSNTKELYRIIYYESLPSLVTDYND